MVCYIMRSIQYTLKVTISEREFCIIIKRIKLVKLDGGRVALGILPQALHVHARRPHVTCAL